MLDFLLKPLPYLTDALPGIGGRLKCAPEDFVVEEIPAYFCSGQGEHLFLWIEKRDLGADYFQRQLAQRLGLPRGEIGMAGLKDRRAITRQWVSVPARMEPRLPALDGDGIRVLDVQRHGNKLRPGHLQGNRFEVRLRGIEHPERLPALVNAIKSFGMPNFYGEQRFGREAQTLRWGWEMLTGRGRGPRPPFLRKLALSAVQSALFNRVLADRIDAGEFRHVLDGDVCHHWPRGGMFLAEDLAAEQARFDRREIVTTGPMFGARMYAAKAKAAERETAALAAAGLAADAFSNWGKLLSGTRRFNLVYVDDLAVQHEGPDAKLRFTLPAGSYATTLLREFTKSAMDEDDVVPTDEGSGEL